MSEEPDSVMLSILKDVQSRLIGLGRRMENWALRQDSLLKEHLAFRRDLLHQDETIANLHVRQDRMETALTRINTRLGLIDTDA